VRLSKKLDGFELDVSWSIGTELAVLFGYSGSGKSLTLRMIAGLVRPDSGRVVLDGEVLYDHEDRRWAPPQERRLGFVTQDLALFPHMNVRRNIAYGLDHLAKQERAQRVDEFVTRFHLEGLTHRHPREISGGQRQRVALARALARHPHALLLDEPFSALDLPLRLELWDLIVEIKETLRIPIVVVTHDPVDAKNFSDRLIVYQQGHVLKNDTPAEVLRRPDAPELKTLAEVGASFGDVSEWASSLEPHRPRVNQ
jgi:molybdate transport system ATP-binding protein